MEFREHDLWSVPYLKSQCNSKYSVSDNWFAADYVFAQNQQGCQQQVYLMYISILKEENETETVELKQKVESIGAYF